MEKLSIERTKAVFARMGKYKCCKWGRSIRNDSSVTVFFSSLFGISIFIVSRVDLQ